MIRPPWFRLCLLVVATACGQAGSPYRPIGSGTEGGTSSNAGTPSSGGVTASSGGVTASSGGAPAAGNTAGGADNGGSSGSGSIPNSGGSGGTSASSGAGGTGGASDPLGVCTQALANPVTIHMIGDSTMSVYASDLYPRMGWGQPLGDLFASQCATVVDHARSGRSSKSFFDEGAWTPVKDALQSGDYVLIQFGHNDEKSDDPTRFTDPQTTYKQYLTTYVQDTRAKLATPLLLTSINRNGWSGTSVSDSHGAYPPAVRELAASLQVELIDLTALTKAYFERLGQAETAKLFLILAAGESANYPSGVTDNTHLQERGARAIGQLAMADAYAQGLTIASYLTAVPVAP